MTDFVDRRVALLLVDGARHDVFEHLVAAGDLPNISRYLLETGGAVPATTVFPSTTGVAYLPFLTGCYPGTCNVPGIRWIDLAQYGGDWLRERQHVRSYCGPQGACLNTDLPDGLPTLFDLEPDTVGMCTPFTRGLGPDRERLAGGRKFWGAVAHYTGGYGPLDEAVGRELCRLAGRHRYVFAVFPGVDGVTHFFDPWHSAVLDMYRGIDRIVGAYAAAGGFDGDHLTLLVSDHGLSRVDQHTDVSLELERYGLPTLRHPVVWRRNPKVAVMVSGNASAQVYLRPGTKRTTRFGVPEIEAGDVDGIPSDLVTFLANLPGVAMIVGVRGGGGGGGDTLILVTRDGRATLTREDDQRIAYHPETADVLEIGGPTTLADREWFTRTLNSRYPDGPTQLSQLFQSPRTGDLIVIAEPMTDLRFRWEMPEHRSGHGSLIAEHMRCLAASNVPLEGPVRTVDLFPLTLDFLGIECPQQIDGVLPSIAGAYGA